MQLTFWGTKEDLQLPTYKQIWNWQKNIDTAIQIIKDEKLSAARKHLQKHANAVLDADKPRFLKMETYKRYNGGKYWKWDKNEKEWIGQTKKDDYANVCEGYESNPPSNF